MGVPKSAWTAGTVWEAQTERGLLKAIIVGKGTKAGYKLVKMEYLDGPGKRYGVVEQEYSHKHMLRYFQPKS